MVRVPQKSVPGVGHLAALHLIYHRSYSNCVRLTSCLWRVCLIDIVPEDLTFANTAFGITVPVSHHLAWGPILLCHAP